MRSTGAKGHGVRITREDIVQSKRNASLIALLDCTVEEGDGVIEQKSFDASPMFGREEVRELRDKARSWFSLKDRLSQGAIPSGDQRYARETANRNLIVLESHWPQVLAWIGATLDEGFCPRLPE